MDSPRVFNVSFHGDSRGHSNFDLTLIKRFYISKNRSEDLFRGWQGYKIEKRWFYFLKGSFRIKLLKIDNWSNPSFDLEPLSFVFDKNLYPSSVYFKRIY